MPTNEAARSRMSLTGRKQMLDGVIIPKKPDPTHDETYYDTGGVWYQTSNRTPFLYLPPVIVHDQLDHGVKVPHYSLDVLITVRTPGNALIVLTGYFNYAIYEWAYYGVDPRDYDAYTPYYWRFMPSLPQGWKDDARADVNPIKIVPVAPDEQPHISTDDRSASDDHD